MCSFLSRLVLCGVAVALILLSPALVRASATTFDVSGTARNISPGLLDSCASGATCAFSGTFQVDTTAGMFESSGLDITLPGLAAFDVLVTSGQHTPTQWIIRVTNSAFDTLALVFTTAPTPGSLVGFTSGSINESDARDSSDNALFALRGGSITPVPEPSSLVLFASGLLVLGLTRRFGKKVGHPLSA